MTSLYPHRRLKLIFFDALQGIRRLVLLHSQIICNPVEILSRKTLFHHGIQCGGVQIAWNGLAVLLATPLSP